MAKVNITNLLKRAEEALNRRNYGLAIFNYIQAVSLQPENIDARSKLRATQTRAANESGGGGFAKALVPYLKAMVLSLIGKSEQAMIACEQAISKSPNSVPILKLLSQCAEKAEFIEVAAWQRQEISEKYDQEDVDNLTELAELYEDLGRGAAAVACYERIMEIDPNADVGPAIRNASALMTTDTFAEALEHGSRAIIKNEEEAEFLEMDAGKLKTDDQRTRTIAYLLEHDVKERPDDHRLYIRLGEICYDMDEFGTGYRESKKYLEKALEITPTDSTARDKLGDLEIKKLRVELLDLKAKLKTDAENETLKSKYQTQNKNRVKFEIQEFERRTKDQPLKAVFHYRLGELYFQTKNFDGAISELQQAGKDPKFKIKALTILGRAFMAMNQNDMAISQFQEAMRGQELFDKICEPLYFEAQALEAKGDKESLQKSLERYTRIYQTDIKYRDVKVKVPELQKKIGEVA